MLAITVEREKGEKVCCNTATLATTFLIFQFNADGAGVDSQQSSN